MVVDDMNDVGVWAQGLICYEQLKVVVDMNDSSSWAQGSRYYEQLRAMVDMKDFKLWAQGSRFYEQLRVIGDMNNSGSYELRHLDAMNNIRLRVVRMILGHELMILNAMNN